MDVPCEHHTTHTNSMYGKSADNFILINWVVCSVLSAAKCYKGLIVFMLILIPELLLRTLTDTLSVLKNTCEVNL